jgi:hypothetical protein
LRFPFFVRTAIDEAVEPFLDGVLPPPNARRFSVRNGAGTVDAEMPTLPVRLGIALGNLAYCALA